MLEMLPGPSGYCVVYLRLESVTVYTWPSTEVLYSEECFVDWSQMRYDVDVVV